MKEKKMLSIVDIASLAGVSTATVSHVINKTGRFSKETDKLVYDFNASINYDKRFLKQDVRGSIAHVTMLNSVDIISDEEKELIIKTLNEIVDDVESGKLEITSKYEDVHSFVEANL